MKNFIFALCGFLMMALMPLNVQASSISEPISSKSDVSVNVGLPMIQNDVVTIIPMDFLVVKAPQTVYTISESPAMQSLTAMNTTMQGKQIIIPKCPFRYIYKSKYCTHYNYTAYSKLITPY